MSNPQDKYADRLHRIHEVAEASNVSPSEPTSDVLEQKMLQEIGQLSQQVKDAKARATQLEKTLAEQNTVLQGIASAQRRTDTRIHQIAEAQKEQPKGLSESDVISLVSDKLSTFKVQLGCLLVVIAMAIGAYLVWPDSDDNNNAVLQKGVITRER